MRGGGVLFEELGDPTAEDWQDRAAIDPVGFGQECGRAVGTKDLDVARLRIDDPDQGDAGIKEIPDLGAKLLGMVVGRDDLDDLIGDESAPGAWCTFESGAIPACERGVGESDTARVVREDAVSAVGPGDDARGDRLGVGLEQRDDRADDLGGLESHLRAIHELARDEVGQRAIPDRKEILGGVGPSRGGRHRSNLPLFTGVICYDKSGFLA